MASFYRTECNFIPTKQRYLDLNFYILLLLHFFYPRKFCCTVQWISNILFYQLHLLHDTQWKKQSLISKHSLLGKDSTTPTSQLQWSQSLTKNNKEATFDITWNITWWTDGNNGKVVISDLVIMLLMLVTPRLQIAGTTAISSVSLMMAIGVKKK